MLIFVCVLLDLETNNLILDKDNPTKQSTSLECLRSIVIQHQCEKPEQ